MAQRLISGQVHVNCRLTSYKVSVSKLKALAEHILRLLGLAGSEVGVELVSSKRMRTLNKKFRHKDKSTDVLSFPQRQFKKALLTAAPGKIRPRASQPALLLGDIVISLPDAESNALSDGSSLDREVCFLLVHGILHLCGHDHEIAAEAKVMFKEQGKIMATINDRGPAPSWAGCARRKVV